MSDSINQTNAVLLDQTTSGVKYTDQNLRTTDSPTFTGITVNGSTSSFTSNLVRESNGKIIKLLEDGSGTSNPAIQIERPATWENGDAFVVHCGAPELGSLSFDAYDNSTDTSTTYLQIQHNDKMNLKNADVDINTNDILNAGKVQLWDTNGNGDQWAGFERIDGTFRLDSENNKYDFDPVDSIIYASNSWFTDTGTNAVITSSNNLVKDSGSSRRFKSEIEPANITMDQIMQIEPKHFYHEQIDEYRHGLIAEQVRDAGLDEWVHENQDGEVESLSYGKFGATVALAGLHDHEERIQKLEQAVA